MAIFETVVEVCISKDAIVVVGGDVVNSIVVIVTA